MMTNAKPAKPSRLMREMQDTAKEMHAIGLMNDASYGKITMRQAGRAEAATLAPLTGDEIRAIREQSNMSQAVFAKYLNLTVGYISQLERGAKRPQGAALVLLNVIKLRGIDVVTL